MGVAECVYSAILLHVCLAPLCLARSGPGGGSAGIGVMDGGGMHTATIEEAPERGHAGGGGCRSGGGEGTW